MMSRIIQTSSLLSASTSPGQIKIEISQHLHGETACILKGLKPSSLCVDHMEKRCRQFVLKSAVVHSLVHRLCELLAGEQDKPGLVASLRQQMITSVTFAYCHCYKPDFHSHLNFW